MKNCARLTPNMLKAQHLDKYINDFLRPYLRLIPICQAIFLK